MQHLTSLSLVTVLALAGASLMACESLPTIGGLENGFTESGTGGRSGGGGLDIEGMGGSGAQSGEDGEPEEPVIEIHDSLPEGFVSSGNGESDRGGWKVVGPWDEEVLKEDLTCGNIVRVVARDFREVHPDFQEGSSGLKQGIVGPEFADLGSDRKPVFYGVGSDKVTDAWTFDTWYRNAVDAQEPETVPLNFVMDMWLQPEVINGVENFVFDSNNFFPLAEMGNASTDCEEGWQGVDQHRNEADGCWGYLFTTELHTNFTYNGGEEFTFKGDDDVWVYINGKLAIDLGGVHGPELGTVALDDVADELGIEVGESYSLDMFQAERQTRGSNFRIQTTLDFSGCSEVVADDGTIIR